MLLATCCACAKMKHIPSELEFMTGAAQRRSVSAFTGSGLLRDCPFDPSNVVVVDLKQQAADLQVYRRQMLFSAFIGSTGTNGRPCAPSDGHQRADPNLENTV